jgi:hypothetical protein
MLKYIKRRRADEDSGNEPKLSEPSTSKSEKEVTDKKIAFTTTCTWTRVLHGKKMKITRFQCAFFCGKKLSNPAVLPKKLSRHITNNYSHLSNKKFTTSNDFWIRKTNNVNFLRRK